MSKSRMGPKPGTPQARHGGEAVREKYGRDYFARIGVKGGAALREKRGARHFQQAGTKGGLTTFTRHGREFYAEIGRKGGRAGKGVARHTPDPREPRVYEVEDLGED